MNLGMIDICGQTGRSNECVVKNIAWSRIDSLVFQLAFLKVIQDTLLT